MAQKIIKGVLERTRKLCEPAMLYLILSVIGLILIGIQNTVPQASKHFCIGKYECDEVTKPTAFVMQGFYVLFWTWLLNLLCKNGFKTVSWFIVLFPFVLFGLLLLGMVTNGVLVVREGYDDGSGCGPGEELDEFDECVPKGE